MRPRDVAKMIFVLLVVTALGISDDRELRRERDSGDESGFRRVSVADCTFERDPDTYLVGFRRHMEDLAARTERVAKAIPRPGDLRTANASVEDVPSRNYIDDHIFGKMRDDGVPHAPLASDAEFLRRATLDLTGRIPTAAEAREFLADENPKKRTDLIARLINTQGFVDKWTMFYGDLLKNTPQPSTTNVIYAEGRNALYNTIYDFVEKNTPYDVFAQKVITANGNSWDYGGATYVFAMATNQGPVQDTYDTFAVRTATQFLGLSNMDCLMCHDGKGHLDKLNVWARDTKRSDAWQLSAFFSRARNTRSANMATTAGQVTYYWTVTESTGGDYTLGSTSGNRTPRTIVGGVSVVRPRYIFDAKAVSPATTANYRESFGNALVHDRQFARAAVNYLWQQMMGMGIVEPADQFDLKRLDPNNVPEGWTVQPSHPALLEALADDFIAGGFNIRKMLETIANSSAYQLSSRFDGDWKIEYAPYFARKFTRRLWAEEVHDAICQATSILPASPGYAIDGPLVPEDNVYYAMQLPNTTNQPQGNQDGSRVFMDYFLRGNRDTNPRLDDGTILQALNMMNNNFVVRRVRNATVGSAVNKLLAKTGTTDDQLIEELYLATLGRYPTAAELTSSRSALKANRTQGAENLQWALLNKLEFLYSY
jgi:hypothetical protein